MNIGWLTGFEPATTATTTQRSTELSYSHHEAALTIEVSDRVGDVADVFVIGQAAAFSRMPRFAVDTGMPRR